MNGDFIWAKDGTEMNVAYIFTADVFAEKDVKAAVNVSAYNFYKFYVNGKLKFFGPSRSPQGYYRTDVRTVTLKKGKNRLSAVCFAYNAATYSYVSDQPFFYFSANVCGKEYTARDFLCYEFTEKVKKAQRYSFQRGFCEIYRQKSDLSDVLLTVEKTRKPVTVKAVKPPLPLKRGVPYIKLKRERQTRPVFSGKVVFDKNKPLFRHTCIDSESAVFDCYKRTDLYECVTDYVCRTTNIDGGIKTFLQEGEYTVYDFGKNTTGYIGLDVSTKTGAEIYIAFDELLGDKDRPVDFARLSCCSVVKWELSANDYRLETAEPYTLRACQVIVKKGTAKIKGAFITLFRNEQAFNLKFSSEDKTVEKIVHAAAENVAQNGVDVLMDCPSRERAGWINDIYFSRESQRFFTGNQEVLSATLEDYLLYKRLKELPKEMIPMCYPSDHKNGEYIPNCATWYLIILCEHLKAGNLKKYRRIADAQIDGLLRFFGRYENEDGLLEDLDSWIFIEWSVAGSKEYVSGINYPSNAIYYKALKTVGEYRGDERLIKKAERVKAAIRAQSFNGEFFEDNRIRKDGKTVPTGHISEACQYYLFSLGVADKESYPELYAKLCDGFSDRSVFDPFPQVGKANIIVGLLMRITVLIENGENLKAVQEIKRVYGVMAEKTGTLWENLDTSASCNHGVAAYAGYILIKALTGFKGFYGGEPIFGEKFLDVNTETVIPCNNRRYKVTVSGGKRTVVRIK